MNDCFSYVMDVMQQHIHIVLALGELFLVGTGFVIHAQYMFRDLVVMTKVMRKELTVRAQVPFISYSSPKCNSSSLGNLPIDLQLLV
jgi:hypothetical protein